MRILTIAELLPPRPKKAVYMYIGMSILSTVLSGLYLAVAIIGPEWRFIRSKNKGGVSISFINILTNLIGKAIEMLFSSLCVLFLGQILTYRSIGNQRQHGVSLAQMNMRNWISDPVSMLSDGRELKLHRKSWLGWFILIASLAIVLYSPATGALSKQTWATLGMANLIQYYQS